ncbi:hypothetical protein [Aliivibrio fischeri]|uniref:hypothetical protein n=1 Tax=Aliivibrio fischeri TaxID=668 RepID=UPI00080DD580|nr:hypothetical protein [Aliivibrio fischeri]MUJ23710.1 hypothetical protein [Aliivibrio fischeri]OCH13505.1 hypothetical protein A6E09_07670 [Aliivibrio fischeri]
MKFKSLIIMNVLVSMPVLGAGKTNEVEQAIEFLKTACVTSGSELNISADAEGALSIKKIKSSGISASVKVSHKQIEGFADAASKLSANQASEMRECMKPYIERIISVYLQGVTEVAPQAIQIETQGTYFDLNEFNLVMSKFAEHPQTVIRFFDAKRLIDLHPAKIDYYIKTAMRNDMIYFHTPNDDKGNSGYVIHDKGVSYVLSKNLLQ